MALGELRRGNTPPKDVHPSPMTALPPACRMALGLKSHLEPQKSLPLTPLSPCSMKQTSILMRYPKTPRLPVIPMPHQTHCISICCGNLHLHNPHHLQALWLWGHLTHDPLQAAMVNYITIMPKPINTVNQHTFHAIGWGNLPICMPNGKGFTLQDVLHTSDIAPTLVSVGLIDEAGYTVTFKDGTASFVILHTRWSGASQGGKASTGSIPAT